MSQHVIPAFPLLAPLLDRMTTNDVISRFTACDALSFCRFIRSSLTSKELENDLPCRPSPEYESHQLSTRNESCSTSSAISCTDKLDKGTSSFIASSLPVLVSGESKLGRWDSLPTNFVAKWSSGGHGWVRLIILSLCLLTDAEDARLRRVTSRKNYQLPWSMKPAPWTAGAT